MSHWYQKWKFFRHLYIKKKTFAYFEINLILNSIVVHSFLNFTNRSMLPLKGLKKRKFCIKFVAQISEWLPKKCKSSFSSKAVDILSHPPYSTDLSPYDYLLFSKLKLYGKSTLNGISDIQATSSDYLVQIAKADFKKWFVDYYICCKKYVESIGDYFE